MKIVHVITSLSSGGAERMLSKIVNGDNLNENIIITLFDIKQFYELDKNVKVIDLKLKQNFLGKLLALPKLLILIRKINPDIIQFWMKTNIYSITKIFIDKDIKLIFNYRNSYYSDGKVTKLLTKMVSGLSDMNIFVSKDAYFSRKNNNFKINNYEIISNGFERKSYEFKLNNKLIFGYIGRYHLVKNQQLLINSLNCVKDKSKFNVLIAGRDLYPNKFDYIDDGLNIEWQGPIKDTDQFYKTIDCLILTSKYEGFPNVIGEAMMHGVPVITTNAGESFDIIGDSGYKITENQNLTSILEDILDNPKQLILKSEKSYEKVTNDYSIEKIIKKYQELYNKVVLQK